MALAADPPPVGVVDAHRRGQLDRSDGLEEGAPALFVAGVVRQAVDRAEKLLDGAVAGFVVLVDHPVDLFEQAVDLVLVVLGHREVGPSQL